MLLHNPKGKKRLSYCYKAKGIEILGTESTFYPATKTQSLDSQQLVSYVFNAYHGRMLRSGRTHKKKIIRTPNILAISHLLEDALAQYLRSSLCAPPTLSTTSSVFASIRSLQAVSTRPEATNRPEANKQQGLRRRKCQITHIISLCSDTIVANCPKMLPSSVMVFSMASMASPLCCI